MTRTSPICSIGLAVALTFLLPPMSVQATPIINGITIIPRVINDCPGTDIASFTNYPHFIRLWDTNNSCLGFTNLHNLRLSADGGSSAAVFNNGDTFRFCTELTLSGSATGVAEAGINIAPWWSVTDGRFGVKASGEVAASGGRLPPFSFTETFGIHYSRPNSIHLEVIYLPNDLSLSNPATIEYKVNLSAVDYTSGPLPFDQGNPADDPPHGQWGIQSPAEVGGYFQFFPGDSGPTDFMVCDFWSICYEPLDVLPTVPTTWSSVKARF